MLLYIREGKMMWWECAQNQWGLKERTHTHFKPQNFGDVPEKRMHWSMAEQRCPLWHLFELNWSVVTDVWSIPHVAQAAEWTENIHGPYLVPGGIPCSQKIRAVPISYSVTEGPRFTLCIIHTCDFCLWSNILADISGEGPSPTFWCNYKFKTVSIFHYWGSWEVHEIKTHQVAI